MKTCTKCGIEKDMSAFGKNSHSADGHRPDCKDCVNAERAEWRKNNPEKWLAARTAYVEKNRKMLADKQAAYRAANPEKVKAAMESWLEKNRHELNRKRRELRLANPEVFRKKDAERYERNPTSFRIRNQTRRARKKVGGGEISKDLPDRLMVLQKGKCACGCNQPLGDNYHLDHIMPLALGGTHEDSNIQLLRPTCNLQKSAKHPIEFMQQRGFLC